MEKFVKIVYDGRRIERAPDHYAGNLSIPTESEHNDHGYYRYAGEEPNPPEGERVASVFFYLEDNCVKTQYTYEPIPPAPTPVRRFSKLKLYGAIAKLGAWDAIESWLRGKEIEGVNGWMAFELAQEISDNHPLFAAWSDEARQVIGIGEAQFEAILNSCLLED